VVSHVLRPAPSLTISGKRGRSPSTQETDLTRLPIFRERCFSFGAHQLRVFPEKGLCFVPRIVVCFQEHFRNWTISLSRPPSFCICMTVFHEHWFQLTKWFAPLERGARFEVEGFCAGNFSALRCWGLRYILSSRKFPSSCFCPAVFGPLRMQSCAPAESLYTSHFDYLISISPRDSLGMPLLELPTGTSSATMRRFPFDFFSDALDELPSYQVIDCPLEWTLRTLRFESFTFVNKLDVPIGFRASLC